MRFVELVDIEDLRELCEKFTALTGAVTAILDLDGNILVATGWQEICTRFHRVHPTTAARCRESDTVLASQLDKGQCYNVYRCRNGLVDVAVPIMVKGQHVANFFTGQFLFEPPDEESFRRQAAEFGFDDAAYLAALARIPIFTPGQIESMMGFLSRLAGFIGEIGLARERLRLANESLRSHDEQLRILVEERTGELRTAKEQAELANSAKGDFLRAITHELRTPLNSIIGFTDLLQAGLAGPVTDEQERMLGIVAKAGRELLGLISNLIEVAHSGSREPEVTLVDFSLRAVLDDQVARYERQAGDKGLSFDCELPEPGLQTRGDPARVGQVVGHLLGNAIKFSDAGRITLRARVDGASIRVEVADTGIGIPSEDLQTLFRPFNRATPPKGRVAEGTGVGLALVRQLVNAMGGEIGAESTVGQGSRFWFTLALATGEPATAHAA